MTAIDAVMNQKKMFSFYFLSFNYTLKIKSALKQIIIAVFCKALFFVCCLSSFVSIKKVEKKGNKAQIKGSGVTFMIHETKSPSPSHTSE